MAKVTGYICDICSTMFAIDSRQAPDLRIMVQVITPQDTKDEKVDICSNMCLLQWAEERAESSTLGRLPLGESQ